MRDGSCEIPHKANKANNGVNNVSQIANAEQDYKSIESCWYLNNSHIIVATIVPFFILSIKTTQTTTPIKNSTNQPTHAKMKANTIVAIVATLVASVAAAPTEKRDLPLLGGHSGIIKSVGPLLDSVESLIPILGGSGSGQGDATGGSIIGGLGAGGK